MILLLSGTDPEVQTEAAPFFYKTKIQFSHFTAATTPLPPRRQRKEGRQTIKLENCILFSAYQIFAVCQGEDGAAVGRGEQGLLSCASLANAFREASSGPSRLPLPLAAAGRPSNPFIKNTNKKGSLSSDPFLLVYPGGFEPLTSGVGVLRSIQLSYEYISIAE